MQLGEFPIRFGKYELLEHLATGGMAEVFRARSFGFRGFEKHLVIKRILPALADSSKFVSLFLKEAQISAWLSHPNIVQVFELGKVEEDHYLAMEFIHGRNLAQVKRVLRTEDERMPIPLAIFLVTGLLRGLAYAHSLTDSRGEELRLVHGDVSPHNVLVSFQGEVKLFDFGIARLTGDVVPEETAGVLLPGGGKYAYMSPEQVAGDSMDCRSDIFSAGIVLYELLVGHRLFEHPDPVEKLRHVREARVPDPRSEVLGISDALWSVLQRMLARKPSDRFADAESALVALRTACPQVHEVDAIALGKFLQGLFEEEANRPTITRDVAGLVRDVVELSESVQNTWDPDREISLEGTQEGRVKGGERKKVAVLAAEVIGLTSPATEWSPEEMVRKRIRLLRKIREEVERFGGVIHRYEDEGFTVLFGVPRAHEDDLKRALSCASRLVQTTQDALFDGPALGLCVGVHSGEVTVGGQGGSHRTRIHAIGDTLKGARRLVAFAQTGEVLLSPVVAERASQWAKVRFKDSPSVGARGGGKTAVLVEVLAKSDKSNNRWIRRGNELQVLTEALADVAQGKTGVLAIYGDGGTGKSLLTQQLLGWSKQRDVPMFVVRGQPYGADRALAPFLDMVRIILDMDRDLNAAQVRVELERLALLGVTERERRLVEELMSVGQGSHADYSLDDVFSVAGQVVRGLASQTPVILAVEDIQHLPPMDMQLIRYILRTSLGLPVLFMVTGRSQVELGSILPERTIFLGRLNPESALRFLKDELACRSVEPALLELIRNTTECNPLYMQEVLAALRETGRLNVKEGQAHLLNKKEAFALPLGLRDLIAARIDTLPDHARRLLEIVTVMGLTFGAPLAERSFALELGGVRQLGADGQTDTEGVAHNAMERLVQADLLVLENTEGQGHFANRLVWEVVMRQLVGQRRRVTHRAVAEGISSFGDEGLVDLHRVSLARHLAAAGAFLQAAQHGRIVVEKLTRQQLLEPASLAVEKALAWVEQARVGGEEKRASVRLEASLRLMAGEVWHLRSDVRKAELHLQIALDLSEEILDSMVEGKALLALGRTYAQQGRAMLAGINFEAATQVAAGVAGLAVDHTPQEVEPWRQRVMVNALQALGELAQDRGDAEASNRHFAEAKEWAGDNVELAVRCNLGLSLRYYLRGGADKEKALAMLAETWDLATSLGDRILMGRVANNVGIVHFSSGDYEAGLKHFQRALRVRKGIGYRRGLVVNLHNVGDAQFRLGRKGLAWSAFEESYLLAKEIGWRKSALLNEAFLVFLRATEVAGLDIGKPTLDAEFSEKVEDPSEMTRDLERIARESDTLPAPLSAAVARWLTGRLLIGVQHIGAAIDVLQVAHQNALSVNEMAFLRDVESDLEVARALHQKSKPVS